MKKILTLALAVILVCSLVACGGSPAPSVSPSGSPSGAPAVSPSDNVDALKVTFITTAGGLGDRSFNDSTWAGVQRAGNELGVDVSLIEPATVADFGSSIVAAANGGANVIIGIGASWTDAFDEYCEKYPNIYFCGLNANAVADNLMMARTADHQGSFLAGALAAMMSKTGTIGAVGGMDGDNINRFLVGYAEGAAYVNPAVKVLKSYVGSFSDPAKGKEFAQQLMNEGADVIYQVAGGTGEGIFEAAKENESLYAIGVDADQDYIVEGKVLTSMMKNCDIVAYSFIARIQNGDFAAGDVVFDLSNNGVGLSPMTYTKNLICEDNLKALEEIREKLVSGEIAVTDLFAQ